MFQIPKAKRIYMYPKPIPMNWGEKKLTQIVRNEMGIEPKLWQFFLFFNKKQNQMKLFFLDDTGSQEFLKLLPKGGFLLPTPKGDEPFIEIGGEKLESLFRMQL